MPSWQVEQNQPLRPMPESQKRPHDSMQLLFKHVCWVYQFHLCQFALPSCTMCVSKRQESRTRSSPAKFSGIGSKSKERFLMCFRPADVSGGANACPECGKTIQMMAGIQLKACPFCKCDFTPYLDGTKPLPNASGAPAAPGAPKAPGAPGAPQAPGAPKAPGGPKPPTA